MSTVDDLLTGARLPEDRVLVCTRMDLVAEWKRLGQDLVAAKAKAAADPRLAGDESTVLVDRMEALRDEVQAATVEFRVRALPRKRWLELVEAHPPRRDGQAVDEEDARMGVNRDTFLPALVRASTVEPQLADETWDALLDPAGELLTVQQWRAWWRSCWNLNVQEMDLPFSVAGLLTSPNSGSESGSPAPSA